MMTLGEPLEDLEKEICEILYFKYEDVIEKMVQKIFVNNPSVVGAEDLKQAGAIALILAYKSYNPSSGSLHHYILRCIKNALIAESNKHYNVFTIDHRIKKTINKIKKLMAKGKSTEETRIEIGLDKKRYEEFLRLARVATRNLDNQTIPTDDFKMSLAFIIDELQLSPFEKDIAKALIRGQLMHETLIEFSISPRTYDRTISQIKQAIKEWGSE